MEGFVILLKTEGPAAAQPGEEAAQPAAPPTEAPLPTQGHWATPGQAPIAAASEPPPTTLAGLVKAAVPGLVAHSVPAVPAGGPKLSVAAFGTPDGGVFGRPSKLVSREDSDLMGTPFMLQDPALDPQPASASSLPLATVPAVSAPPSEAPLPPEPPPPPPPQQQQMRSGVPPLPDPQKQQQQWGPGRRRSAAGGAAVPRMGLLTTGHVVFEESEEEEARATADGTASALPATTNVATVANATAVERVDRGRRWGRLNLGVLRDSSPAVPASSLAAPYTPLDLPARPKSFSELGSAAVDNEAAASSDPAASSAAAALPPPPIGGALPAAADFFGRIKGLPAVSRPQQRPQPPPEADERGFQEAVDSFVSLAVKLRKSPAYLRGLRGARAEFRSQLKRRMLQALREELHWAANKRHRGFEPIFRAEVNKDPSADDKVRVARGVDDARFWCVWDGMGHNRKKIKCKGWPSRALVQSPWLILCPAASPPMQIRWSDLKQILDWLHASLRVFRLPPGDGQMFYVDMTDAVLLSVKVPELGMQTPRCVRAESDLTLQIKTL